MKQLETVFATLVALACALLAPCVALAGFDDDCERSLIWPVAVLISPLIHEVPNLKPDRYTNGAEKRGWIEPRPAKDTPRQKRPRTDRIKKSGR